MEQSPGSNSRPDLPAEILEKEFKPDFFSKEVDPLFETAVRRVAAEDRELDYTELQTAAKVFQEYHRAIEAVDFTVRTHGLDEDRVANIVRYFDTRVQQLIERPDVPLQD